MKEENTRNEIKKIFENIPNVRYSALKIWLIENKLLKKVEVINFELSQMIRQRYNSSFLDSKHYHAGNFLWNFYKNEVFFKEFPQWKEWYNIMLKLIKINSKGDTIYGMFDEKFDSFIFKFDKKLLPKLLSITKVQSEEFYLFDDSFTWTICSNHEDQVFFATNDPVQKGM